MNYYQITVHTQEEAVEALSDAFWALESDGVEIFDPTDVLSQEANSLNWDYMDEDFRKELEAVAEKGEVLMRVYFSEDVLRTQTDLEELLLRIREAIANTAKYLPVGSGEIETLLMAEETWANAWKAYYKPFRLGKRIHIVPSWTSDPEEPGEVLIRLDPGMAFGTGTHETTSLCLTTLEEDVQAGDTVIDIGCGSGILGIAAKKLGAGTVIGTDLDPVAVEVARENAAENAADVAFYYGDLAKIPELRDVTADIVVANIMADIILLLAPQAKLLLREGGKFICSGILTERREEVEAGLVREGYRILRRFEKGSWVCLEAELL